MRNRAAVWPLLALLLFGAAASAQTVTPDKRAAIDRLLEQLKTAPTEEAAAPLEARLRELWLSQGSPAVTLLMSRGLRDLKAGANQDAADDFSDAITLDPALAEAWRQRAIARYEQGDTRGALHDLEEALKLEPRDFGIFETLARIAEGRKDWKSAYAAWQKLMEISPKSPGGEQRLKDLRRRALGEQT